MNSLEQYLKPPNNNQEEELYNEDGERGEDENDYIQNQENGNDNGDNNQDMPNQQGATIQDSNNINILQSNQQYDDENNDIIQGINCINTIGNKNNNYEKTENKYDNEDVNNNNENEKNEFEYINNNFLNMNENSNTDTNSPDELMNELLYKIRKIKENRAKANNNLENDINKINNINNNNTNNIDSLLSMGLEKTKSKKFKNEYIGKLNINNQVFQNNPKMKELANLLKEYNRDKNENDKMQINFYNNNQINIVKPEVFFNNNNIKNKNIDYYDKNYEKKHYISVIDGKAIIKGQRINVNSGLQMAQNNLRDKKITFNDFNNKNKLFDFNNDKFMEKRNKLNNTNTKWATGNNLDFKLNNLNFLNNNEINFKVNNDTDNKIKFNKLPKSNFLSKDYYNEELNKINDSLFNIDNTQNRLRK